MNLSFSYKLKLIMSSNLGFSDDIFFLNVHSLRNSHDQLCVFFQSLTMQPLIIALCNTLFTNKNPVYLHPFTEYQTVVCHRDR